MTILFGEYELLATSGLFDAEYYRKTNPDIASLNIDPLMHYLEQGSRDGRDPSADFDTAHYLKLCEALGEVPSNALAHYLTVGIGRGLTPKPGAIIRPDRPSSMLCVDIPRIIGGAADAPVQGGLSIVGWGLATGGATGVEIALDGLRVANARHGLRRPDVAAAHPEWPEALLSGYAAHLPPKALEAARHQVTVSMRDREDRVTQIEFSVEVVERPEDHGPSALRRKMSQTEIDQGLDVLHRLDWRARFHLYLTVDPSAVDREALRRTFEALARQAYTEWELWLMPTGAGAKAMHTQLTAALGDGGERIHVWDGKKRPSRGRSYAMRLAAGDDLGCDALLELALAAALEAEAEFLYCDERRMSPAGKVEAYFKPGWSPDLLLSTNYVGGAWCADSQLLARTGVEVTEFCAATDYAMALRLTEAARGIRHVAKLLYQGGHAPTPDAQQRRALGDALKRRGIVAEIQSGSLDGHYRVKRKLKRGKVSIILPTCAAGGFVKNCVESLRDRTAYRDYEIICIENIPFTERRWKRWLKTRADVVIETQEPFNWSRYNNLAAERASGSYLLFLNDDMEIIAPDWLDAMLEQAQRPEVGAVGALLLYPDRSVQQAGVMLDDAGRGRHAFRHLPANDPGYFGLAVTQRNVISVTGACLMTRRDTFAALGGFDESHAIINNDLDYCLRARERGLLNVYTPHARLVHHELGSRAHLDEHYDADKFRHRWGALIARGDPYFNPHLARDQEQWGIESEPLETVYAGHPLVARASVRRILAVKLDHIGDCITALPALRRLHQLFPAARIAVLSSRASASIWKAERYVDEVIEFNFFHARSGLGKVDITAQDNEALAAELGARRFDLAIDLRKQPDTREVLQSTGARFLAGFDSQGRFPWLDVALEWDEDVPLRTKHQHVSDDLIALVDAVSTQCEAQKGALLSAPSGSLSLPKPEQRRLFSKPLICVHPASGSPMRQWPLPKFSALIDLLLDLERYHVAVIGGPDESSYVEPLFDGAEPDAELFNLVGRFGLEELPRLLARSVLFVGNNSGPQHVAAGLGIPTVGIHSGVVDATEWGPIGPRAVALRRAMSCSPCFLEYPKDCHRGVACLTDLPVRHVYQACVRALARA